MFKADRSIVIVLTESQKNQFINDNNGDEFGLVCIKEKYFQPIAIKNDLYILPEDPLLDAYGIKREVNEIELITGY